MWREGVRHRAEVFVNRKLAAYELVLQSPFEEDGKQDSEYRGFLRLAPMLKAAFPHLGMCIPGDKL